MTLKEDVMKNPGIGTQVKPFLHFADVWPRHALVGTNKMQSYKLMEKDGLLQVTRVVFVKPLSMVIIEYMTTMPHEWCLEELKKRYHEVLEKLEKQMSIE